MKNRQHFIHVFAEVMASNDQSIPRVGLRYTVRFQAVTAEEEERSRVWFCKKIILGHLRLKVEDVLCIQWNQQEKSFDVTLRNGEVYGRVAEVCQKDARMKPLACYKIFNLDKPNFRVITVHMFNPFVTDLALSQFLGQFGEVVTAARYVKDPMGFWTGRRQFQVLLNSDSDGPDCLRHPPAFFSLGGDRGYLFYSRQPAFCRRCRQSGHTEEHCSGDCCRFCGQGGHDAKDCTAPKACHSCGGVDHLYRSCPGRKKTFAEVAKASTAVEGNKEPRECPAPAETVPRSLVQAEKDAGPSGDRVDDAQRGQGPVNQPNTEDVAKASSVDMEGASTTLTPVPCPNKKKHGARRVSQALGEGLSPEKDNGEEKCHNKRPKGEAKGEKKKPTDNRDDGQKVDDLKDGGAEEQGGDGTGRGAESSMEQSQGSAGVLLPAEPVLDFELSPGLYMFPSPLREDAYEGPNRPAISPNTVPLSWADQVDSDDLYSQ